MKHLRIHLPAVLSFFMLFGCTSISDEIAAENTVKTVLFAIAQGNTDTAIANMTFPDIPGEDKAAIAPQMPNFLLQIKENIFDTQDGLKSVEIIETVFSDDHRTAAFSYILVYGNETRVPGKMGLIKVDGVWKSILSFMN